MSNKWIRKNDRVVILSGNDKGKAGQVLSKKEDKIVVQGVNIRKKHIKRTQENQSAQIIEMEMPLHISNVALCSSDDKPIKVKVKGQKKDKSLIYFENGKEILLRKLKEKVK